MSWVSGQSTRFILSQPNAEIIPPKALRAPASCSQTLHTGPGVLLSQHPVVWNVLMPGSSFPIEGALGPYHTGLGAEGAHSMHAQCCRAWQCSEQGSQPAGQRESPLGPNVTKTCEGPLFSIHNIFWKTVPLFISYFG